MAQAYFLLLALGFPVTILVLAVLAGLFHPGCDDVLDWKPIRSPQREAELHRGEVDQMLAALNKNRCLRGAPERSLEEVALHTASLKLYIRTLPPPDTL
jgi:hypothetical protein